MRHCSARQIREHCAEAGLGCVTNSALRNKAVNKTVWRDVKRRITAGGAIWRHLDFGNLSSIVSAHYMGDFTRATIFDRNVSDHIRYGPINGRRRQRHIERHTIVMGRQRLEVSTNLVAHIAAPCRAVGSGDNHVYVSMLHQMPARIVGNIGMRYTVTA